MKSILLIGQVACGKGTQSKMLQERFGMYPIGMGDILRDHKKRGTAIGKMATELDKDGKLMPNNIIIGLMKDEILKNKDRVNGFIFDGAVRTIAQAIALEEMLTSINIEYEVVYLEIDDEKAVKRALKRGETSGRIEDSNEEVIRKRVKVYHENTDEVILWYSRKGWLNTISATKKVDSIHSEIKDLLTYRDGGFTTRLSRFKNWFKKNLGFISFLFIIYISSMLRTSLGIEWGVFALLTMITILKIILHIVRKGGFILLFTIIHLMIPITIFLVSQDPLLASYYYGIIYVIYHINELENINIKKTTD